MHFFSEIPIHHLLANYLALQYIEMEIGNSEHSKFAKFMWNSTFVYGKDTILKSYNYSFKGEKFPPNHLVSSFPVF